MNNEYFSAIPRKKHLSKQTHITNIYGFPGTSTAVGVQANVIT